MYTVVSLESTVRHASRHPSDNCPAVSRSCSASVGSEGMPRTMRTRHFPHVALPPHSERRGVPARLHASATVRGSSQISLMPTGSNWTVYDTEDLTSPHRQLELASEAPHKAIVAPSAWIVCRLDDRGRSP